MSKRVNACKNQNIRKFGLKPGATAWTKKFFNRILRRVQNDALRRDQLELEVSEEDPEGLTINRGARWKR
jgi:hypothetical protein